MAGIPIAHADAGGGLEPGLIVDGFDQGEGGCGVLEAIDGFNFRQAFADIALVQFLDFHFLDEA